jgi:hypothetical protein
MPDAAAVRAYPAGRSPGSATRVNRPVRRPPTGPGSFWSWPSGCRTSAYGRGCIGLTRRAIALALVRSLRPLQAAAGLLPPSLPCWRCPGLPLAPASAGPGLRRATCVYFTWAACRERPRWSCAVASLQQAFMAELSIPRLPGKVSLQSAAGLAPALRCCFCSTRYRRFFYGRGV